MFDTLENALDALVSATPVPTFVIDANHCVRHWNVACEKILGYPASAMIGTNDQWKPFYAQRRPVMADLVASGCIDSLIQTYYAQKFRPSRTIPGSYEAEDFFPHLGRDGVWFYFTAAPIRDAHGRIIGAVETLQDITDRKRSEEAMRQGEARLRATVENTPSVMILWLDAEQRIVFANRAVEDMLGHTPDRLLGATPAEAGLLAGAAQAVLDEILALVRQGKPASAPREVQAFTASGDSRVLLIHAYPIPGPDDGARHALVATDVTAARRAEGALRREHLRLKSIIDHFPGGITLMDEQLRIVEHNREFLRLLDFPAELFADGAPSLETLLRFNAGRGEYEPCGNGDQDTYVRSVMESAAQPRPHAFERVRPDGTVLEVRGTPLPLGGFVTSYTDVSWRKQTEQQLKAVLDEHRVIFDNAHVGIAYIQGRKILRCNQRMAEIFGYDGPDDLVGQRTWLYYPDRERWEAHGRQLYEKLAARGYSDGEVELRRRDGTPVWCYLVGRPLDPAKPHAGSIWVYSDITEKKQQESQLELASTVFDNSTEALLVCDAENRIVSVNRAFTRITGYEPEEVVGRPPSIFKSGRHDKAFYQAMWQSLMTDGRWEGEIWDRRRNGEVYPKWLSISVVRDERQRVLHYVAAFTDITRRKAAEDRVQFLAHHDALTGLPNRVMVQDRFARSARLAMQNGRQLALLFLDMDQFKRVNDSLGHRTGDALLVAAVNRLRHCLRESDTISRQGGDEFVVLVEDIRSPEDAAGVARKIIGCMDTAFDIGGHALSTSFSIGIALFPRDGQDFDTLLQKADTAMYHAKESGRSTFSFFDDRMNTQATERLALHGQLRQALARGELALDFQPQSIIRTGRVFGAEALLRWRPAGLPPVCPSRFIPIAEESGLILPIGEWVIHEAFRQARLWQDAGHPLHMSINVSGLQVFRTDLAATLAAAQRDTGVPARRIEIELTESILMEDADSAREVLGQLKRAGHSIAIDDFGTGYSSLAYLKKFPIDKLKIDRSFVTDLCENPEDQAIARAIIQIARALDLRVIAEGVETPAQLALLRKQGCHEAQGYLIGRPGNADQTIALTTPVRP